METLHHVAVTVDDIAAALDWYSARFDAETAYADDSWAMLRFDNVALALVLPDRHPPHIAVERPDARSHGSLVRHRDGTASAYIEDPWGNVIEIMQSDGAPR